MSWVSVSRYYGLVTVTVGGAGGDRFQMSSKDAIELMHKLQDILFAVVCPPDCCGRQMEAVGLVVDGRRTDLWRCPECGTYRSRVSR